MDPLNRSKDPIGSKLRIHGSRYGKGSMNSIHGSMDLGKGFMDPAIDLAKSMDPVYRSMDLSKGSMDPVKWFMDPIHGSMD